MTILILPGKTIQDLGIEARISAEIGGATYYGLFEGIVIDPGIRITVSAEMEPDDEADP